MAKSENEIRKTLRFKPVEIAKIEAFMKEAGMTDFTKALKFLTSSSLSNLTFHNRAAFDHSLAEISANNLALNKIGINLNNLLILYATGKVPAAEKLITVVQELQKAIIKNQKFSNNLVSHIKTNK